MAVGWAKDGAVQEQIDAGLCLLAVGLNSA